ncbi:outer membrane protein assembly factor BamA [Candidatus Vallotia cooleyia]|uniref:outer membrane protein assembly factor BamA n=1 Tax=Candidatus Vallotiella adelgis TaxID=1177211 RepID=UPI001D00B162|nr:outer membrane protein assembly factor BamA [Candidatus Vallotia cooleyia]UDG81898.1 Outer membrane protein assembly factor BamA [Candidatus Vallotia cooleyia]
MLKHRRFATKTVAAVFFATYGMVAHATVPFVVKDIFLEGLQQIQPGAVFAYLPLKQGDIFTDAKGSESIRALYATGFFSNVKVLAQHDVVVVNLKEKPIISLINLSGNHEFSKENLTNVLRAVGLSNGSHYNKTLIDKSRQELKRQYLIRGFYAAEVKTAVKSIDRKHISLLFLVIEGPRAQISQIHFIGNTAFSSSRLRNEMRLSTSNWFSWYTKSNLYSPKQLADDLENIRSYYLNRGYLEFNIDSTRVLISPDKKNIHLTITLNEGEPYQVSSIHLTGNLLGKKNEFDRLLRMKPGDRFSEEKLQSSTRAILRNLNAYGYAFSSISIRPEIDKEHQTVSLVLRVDLGRRIYVRHINIAGNNKTRDEVIRREMRQLESSWLDNQKLILSKDRISRLGYFADVDMTVLPVDGIDDQVDIDVKVTEKPTGATTLGVGFSSSDKIVLSATTSQDNVFGSGTSLSVDINTAYMYRTLAVTQVNPYFTIDGIKRIIDVYYRTYYPLYYSTNSSFRFIATGGNLKFGIPFSEADIVYFGVGVEQNRLDIDSSMSKNYIDYVNKLGCTSNNIPITISWSSDTRDNALAPSDGYYAQANAEYGTSIGTVHYYKADLQAQYYYAFDRGVVLGLNLKGGYGNGLDGKPYPIFKNYFAGGAGSVRGYESGSLGPRDQATNDPIGGAKMIVGNIECMFPLPGTGYNRAIRLFTFLDIGNVWGTEDNSTDKNSLRYGYGLGLAWISPIGPLKLSLGFPLIKHNDDQYQKLQFQVGTAF